MIIILYNLPGDGGCGPHSQGVRGHPEKKLTTLSCSGHGRLQFGGGT